MWLSHLQGVLYGLTRKGRVLIADEMGVGKTVQALALAACYQVGTAWLQHHSVLVVPLQKHDGLHQLRTHAGSSLGGCGPDIHD